MSIVKNCTEQHKLVINLDLVCKCSHVYGHVMEFKNEFPLLNFGIIFYF